MKKREEAWLKIDDLAKQNPTFDEIAATLTNYDDQFLMFFSTFNMVDDDDILLGEEDLLPVTSNTASSVDKCDTQVNC